MTALSGRHVALLQGGPGSEREVSLVSARSVRRALEALGATVVDVDVRGPDFELPDPCDLAFNVIHGTFGEDGALQAVLEARGIPYTGAGSASSRLAFDKVESKRRFEAAGVPTPAFAIVPAATLDGALPLSLPVVIKPPREGSSVGVHIVRDPGAVGTALADAGRFGDEVLVEAFVEGRELTVGILGDEALPIVEIQPNEGFYDMHNKYPWMGGGGGSRYTCPAVLSAEETQAVQEAGLAAHRALGIEVYSRVDVLLHADGSPWVLEVNTIPGMTESSLLPKAAAAAGLDFESLCLKIAELSLKLRNP